MSDDPHVCIICKGGTHIHGSQSCVVYGECKHEEHLQCVLRFNKSGCCKRCRKGGVCDTNDSEKAYLLGVYSDSNVVMGRPWSKYMDRIRSGPITFSIALEHSPVMGGLGGGPFLDPKQEIDIVPVDPRELVMAGHRDESRTQGMARTVFTQKQHIISIIRDLSNDEYPLETLRHAGIDFNDLKQVVIHEGGKPCTFITWKKRTGLAPRDMIALGATFTDLIACGLTIETANSELIDPMIYIRKPLGVTYVTILKELCAHNWEKFFSIRYSSVHLRGLRLTIDALLGNDSFGWVDFQFLQYMSLPEICTWGFTRDHVKAVYRTKYGGDASESVFCAMFCTELMRWTCAECATHLNVKFRASSKTISDAAASHDL